MYCQARERYILTEENDIVYCKNIPELLNLIGPTVYQLHDWHLLIEESESKLKCVSSQNGNKASIRIGHSTGSKQIYQNIKISFV